MNPPDLACGPHGAPVDLKKVRVAECQVLARALDPYWTNRWPNCKAFMAALRDALSRPRPPVKKLGSRQLQAARRQG
jgi:hypothetical protein